MGRASTSLGFVGAFRLNATVPSGPGHRQLAVRIDPQTNKVTARYVPPADSGGVAADDNGA